MTTDDGRHAHKHYQDQIDDLLQRSEDAIERDAAQDIEIDTLRRRLNDLNIVVMSHDHPAIAAHALNTDVHLEPLEPTPEPVYGQREGPRPVETPPGNLDTTLNGATVARDAWYSGSYGDGIVNGTIIPDDPSKQVAVYVTRGATLADLEFRGERALNDNHIGTVDYKDGYLAAYNVTVRDAKGQGFEAGNAFDLHGLDIEAEIVALGGGRGSGGVAEDSVFTLVGGKDSGGHWGAMKFGRGSEHDFTRCNFHNGPAWLDSGCDDIKFTDCLFEGSPKRGLHNEIATGPVHAAYCTFRRNSWGRNLTEEKHGHATAQNGPVILRNCLIELAGNEIGFAQFDQATRPGSSAGSAIRDTKIIVAADFEGYVFAIKEPELVEISGVVLTGPNATDAVAKMGGLIMAAEDIPGVTVV